MVVLQNLKANGRDQRWGSIHNEDLESQEIWLNIREVLKSKTEYWWGIETRYEERSDKTEWLRELTCLKKTRNLIIKIFPVKRIKKDKWKKITE